MYLVVDAATVLIDSVNDFLFAGKFVGEGTHVEGVKIFIRMVTIVITLLGTL